MKDVWTLSSLSDWLGQKDPDEVYEYVEVRNCLLAQYLKAKGAKFVLVGPGTASGIWMKWGFIPVPFTRRLPAGFNDVACCYPHTFGAALARISPV